MKKPTPMFPGWLRAWHWVNAFLFLALVGTGFALHYGEAVAGGYFRWAVMGHNATGVACTLAYVFYLASMIWTGHWRQYVPRRPFFRRAARQVRYYLSDIFQGGHHPFPATVISRFNPLQQVSYIGAVFLMFPVQIGTGLLLLFPLSVPEKVASLPGLLPVAIGHSVTAYVFTMFLIVHVYLAITVSEPHTGIRAMLFGDRKKQGPEGAEDRGPGSR